MNSTLYILFVSMVLAMLVGCSDPDHLWMADGNQTSAATQKGDDQSSNNGSTDSSNNGSNAASSNNGGTTGASSGGSASSSNNGSVASSNNGSASGSNNGDNNSTSNTGGTSGSNDGGGGGGIISSGYAIVLLALENDSLELSGKGALRSLGDIAVNSKDKDAVSVDGCAYLSANELFLRGGHEGKIDAKIRDLTSPVADPKLSPPLGLIVRSTKALQISKSTELSPGIYHGGIFISGGPSVKVTMKPGYYVLDGNGGLGISTSGEVAGSGAIVIVDAGMKISASAAKVSLDTVYTPAGIVSLTGGETKIGSLIAARMMMAGGAQLSAGH